MQELAPLPSKSTLYLQFKKAPHESILTRFQEQGLRYLGIVTTYTYAFYLESTSTELWTELTTNPMLNRFAVGQPYDKLETDVLHDFLRSDSWVHSYRLTFWGEAFSQEISNLLPHAAEKMRLPREPLERILEERSLIIDSGEMSPAALSVLVHSPFVASIGREYPIVAHNEASKAQSRANILSSAPYNLTGQDVLIGHWDGGQVGSHRDFGNRVENKEGGGASAHATHTAGTILGEGRASGFAPNARMIAYNFYGDATAERRQAKHSFYHEHDNHSWGADSGSFGGYSQRAKTFDLDTRDLLMLGVKSAGNDGRRNEVVDENYGFDSLSVDSTCKNLLIIGATKDDGDLAGFSSRGPTNDGRIKPDLSANGNNLNSTLPNNRYGNMSGTSMSAPSVSGIIALLSELFKRENQGRRWAPDMIRTVLLHTVTDVFHEGPDYRHGWGNANAQAAAELIVADSALPGQILFRGAVRDKESIEYQMLVPQGAPETKVTISWLDAFSDSTAQKRLINDVDLSLIAPDGTIFYPWTLNPEQPFDNAVQNTANRRDNVEQVLVKQPTPGMWTVKIEGAAITDPRLDVQGFVGATAHPIARSLLRITPSELTRGPIEIPDSDSNGTSLTFSNTDTREINSLRLFIDISAEARGDIRIDLIHPDGTSVMLEKADNSSRRDIYAIYPDLRSWDEDVTSFYGKSGQGDWQVKVTDTQSGNSSVILSALLEIDFDGDSPVLPNQPPVANAGKDQTVMADTIVTLDASQSSDPEGQTISFSWSQSSGPPITLSNNDMSVVNWTAPELSQTTTFIFRVTVKDSLGAMSSDEVKVTVLGQGNAPQNQDPIAKVEYPMIVRPETSFIIDASGSTDPDNDTLSFRWLQTAGEPVTIDNENLEILSLTAPATTGQLGFRLELSDGNDGLDLVDLTITVSSTQAIDIKERWYRTSEIEGDCGCSTVPTKETRGTNWGLVLLLFILGAIRPRSRK